MLSALRTSGRLTVRRTTGPRRSMISSLSTYFPDISAAMRSSPGAGLHGRECCLHLALEHQTDTPSDVVEICGCDIARAGQIDRDNFLDPAGAGRHHDNAVAEQNGFLDIVRDEYCGPSRSAPDPQQFLLHHGAGLRIEGGERL